MFLDNKYTKYYFKIINLAPNIAKDDCCEKHHIIPVSLGGTDDVSNLIRLSPRTHYLCHLLLTKMTSGENRQKMAYALSFFNTGCRKLSRTKPNSRWYEYSKKLLSEVKKGQPASQACLDAVSKAKKGVAISDERKDNTSKILKDFYTNNDRKQQQRDNTRFIVVLKSPAGDIFTFDSLTEVKSLGPVSTIQLAPVNKKIKIGKWAGWTKLKYEKAKNAKS